MGAGLVRSTALHHHTTSHAHGELPPLKLPDDLFVALLGGFFFALFLWGLTWVAMLCTFYPLVLIFGGVATCLTGAILLTICRQTYLGLKGLFASKKAKQ